MTEKKPRDSSTLEMVNYSMGAVPVSLIMNTFSAFAMLFYTKALGLNPAWAGVIMAVSTAWDAVTDPVMGHISDNTHGKYGRRHPYIFFGGIVLVCTFALFWFVPDAFLSNKILLVGYLAVVNIMLRTALTVYIVPYAALGFEICQVYTGRTKLQGIKIIINMLANICGPAMAWAFFFKETDGAPRAVTVSSNYLNMGIAFALVSLATIFYTTFSTRNKIIDSRDMPKFGKGIGGFFADMKEIITDRYFRWVFSYGFLVLIGIVLVSSFQMYVYEDFMKFGPTQKSIVHGGTMVGMMLGAALSSWFAKQFDKKGTIYIGGGTSIVSGVLLASLLLTGIIVPGHLLTVIVFALLNALYWFGNGVMFPVVSSILADISEINEIKTGVNKDGAYSAVYSFITKLSSSGAMLIVGACLAGIGFVEGIDVVQPPEVVRRLLFVTFVIGPVISATALLVIRFYPVNANFLQSLRENPESTD
ncbi:MAG: MFS transporter [Verrucomicrobiota bacterium]